MPRLEGLLDGLPVIELAGDPTVAVSDVTHDSRRVRAGALFFCVPGAVDDGHDFAPDAVRGGAVALVCERRLDLPVTQAVVGEVRRVMGPVAAAFHDHPSRALDVVGVTGTNGKTTTTHLLAAILDRAGRPCGVIGTLTGTRTTPEAPDLQARLAELRAERKSAVAMEVSSHALDLHRVDGTRFAVAVFTNLGRDHLDHHGTVEAYFQAKARLFEPSLSERAVVNLDDPRGALLRDAAQVPTVGFRLADAEGLELAAGHSRFRWRGTDVELPLGGRFNVSNALAAMTAAALLGVDEMTIAAGIAAAGPVPGRFEIVDAGQPFRVVVDYAHTPDGLEELLRAARDVAPERVLVVFGAGGDRDRSKRPAMGAAAAAGADVVVVTSDNPRSEAADAIIDAVVEGITDLEARRAASALVIESDRRTAIAAALSAASDGDVVVIAGKGHEDTQTIGHDVLPFDDRVVVREELARLGWSGSTN